MRNFDEEILDDRCGICPKCGLKYDEMWDYHLDDGEYTEIECECGCTFTVSLSISMTYTSYIEEEK